jgi:hypothetical protein
MFGQAVVAIDDDPPAAVGEELERVRQISVEDLGPMVCEGVRRGQDESRREIEERLSGDR